MSLPTEVEIRDGAKRLGLADEHGNYPQNQRAKIAKALQMAQTEDAAVDNQETGNTAVALARFDAELAGHLVSDDARARILAVAAAHLLRTGGLNLQPREETTPS